MTIKLNYNATYTFTSAEIYDATQPILIFTAITRPTTQWANLYRTWIKAGAEDASQAIEIVGRVIVGVEQDGQYFAIEGREGAEALHAAIEEASPGYGDAFIINLAIGHYNLHFNRLDALLKN